MQALAAHVWITSLLTIRQHCSERKGPPLERNYVAYPSVISQIAQAINADRCTWAETLLLAHSIGIEYETSVYSLEQVLKDLHVELVFITVKSMRSWLA
jgi:hypothetical protein